MQATAMRCGAAGRADQRPEPGRIDEGDPVQVHDQRLVMTTSRVGNTHPSSR